MSSASLTYSQIAIHMIRLHGHTKALDWANEHAMANIHDKWRWEYWDRVADEIRRIPQAAESYPDRAALR